MSATIPARLRQQVLARDQGRCAYCRSPAALLGIALEVDHIQPLVAGGKTELDNLCLACPTCNRHKAIRVNAIDPASGQEVPLFHPLRDKWPDHFVWSGDRASVIGLTPTGQATISALQMNRPVIVQVRRYWATLGLHLPAD